MTWQDELKELDARLAAGSVSADDYRIARDEILRQAGSGTAQSATSVSRPAEAPSAPQQPGTDPRPDPFGQPFKWEKQQPDSDRTAMLPQTGERQSGESDRTQVVEGPSGETTQRVPGVGEAPIPGPWSVARPDQQPPGQHPGTTWPPLPGQQPQWGSQDFGPVVPPNTGWMMQGPETFEKVPSHGKRVLGIVVVAVVAVGLVVAGIFYFANRGSDQGGPGPTSPTNQGTATRGPESSTRQLPEPPAPKGAPADTASALVDPPGTVRGGGGPLDLAALQSKELLPKSVVSALEQAGMTDGLLKTTSVDKLTLGMYALTVKSEDDARTVALAYGQAQRDGGVPSNENLSMQGVPVYSTPEKAKDQVFRAVYVLYERVVIVETFGPNRQAVQTQFEELLSRQVNGAPPSLRRL